MSESAMHDPVVSEALRQRGPQCVVNGVVAKYGLDNALRHVEVACHVRAAELNTEGVDEPQRDSWSAAAQQIALMRSKSRHVRNL